MPKFCAFCDAIPTPDAPTLSQHLKRCEAYRIAMLEDVPHAKPKRAKRVEIVKSNLRISAAASHGSKFCSVGGCKRYRAPDSAYCEKCQKSKRRRGAYERKQADT